MKKKAQSKLSQKQIIALSAASDEGYIRFDKPHGKTINSLIKRGLLNEDGTPTEAGRAIAFEYGLTVMSGHNAITSRNEGGDLFCLDCGECLMVDNRQADTHEYKAVKVEGFTCRNCEDTKIEKAIEKERAENKAAAEFSARNFEVAEATLSRVEHPGSYVAKRVRETGKCDVDSLRDFVCELQDPTFTPVQEEAPAPQEPAEASTVTTGDDICEDTKALLWCLSREAETDPQTLFLMGSFSLWKEHNIIIERLSGVEWKEDLNGLEAASRAKDGDVEAIRWLRAELGLPVY